MSGLWTWCADDFCEFYEAMTLLDGEPARLDGHLRLIVREFFAQAPDSHLLVMLPKGNGKTALMAALAVFHLLVTRNANCYIGAADKGQAKEMYRFACHYIGEGSEYGLTDYAKVLGGTLEIRSKRDQGFIVILASDDSKQGGKKQGLNATLFLLDELHAHENDSLYTDARSGLFKRGGVMATITTAGWDQESTLGKVRTGFLEADQHGGTVSHALECSADGGTRENVERGRLTIARIGQNVMLEWALRPKGHPLGEDDPNDDATVALANPASWVTLASIQNARQDPGITPWTFRRYRANLWTLAYNSWLPAGAWHSLIHPDVLALPARSWLDADDADLDAHIALMFEPGAEVVAALDMARYRDCASITVLGPGPDGLTLARSLIWRSGGPDNPIPYEPVKRAFRRIHEVFTLRAAGFDPKYFDQAGSDLLAEGLAMEEFPQSNERMCPAAADLRYGIVTERRFAHDGDPIFTAHIMAAVAADIGDGAFKLVKSKKTGPPIDGCVSFAMANTLHSAAVEGGSMYDEEDANL